MRHLLSVPPIYPALKGNLLLKAIVSLGLIFLFMKDMDLRHLWASLHSLPLSHVAAALSAVWLSILIMTKRWQVLLRGQGYHFSFGSLFRATFIGFFFNQGFPSSIGGDVFKIYLLRQQGLKLSSGFSSVFLERLYGLIALSVLGPVAIFFDREVIMASSLKGWVLCACLVFMGTLIGLICLILLPMEVWRLFKLHKFLPFFNTLQEAVKPSPKAALLLILSFVNHLVLIGCIQFLATGMMISITWLQLFVALPMVFLFMALPISLAGWGIREGTMIAILGLYGVSQEAALIVSLSYGAVQVLAALPSLLLWFMARHQRLVASFS